MRGGDAQEEHVKRVAAAIARAIILDDLDTVKEVFAVDLVADVIAVVLGGSYVERGPVGRSRPEDCLFWTWTEERDLVWTVKRGRVVLGLVHVLAYLAVGQAKALWP